jgi:hypothetical protein
MVNGLVRNPMHRGCQASIAATITCEVNTCGRPWSIGENEIAVSVKRLRKFRETVCQRGLQDNHASSAVSAIALFLLTP